MNKNIKKDKCVISKNFSLIHDKKLKKSNYKQLNDSIEEIITNISELDNKHSYTVARIIENEKCVELHYNNGEATLEFDTKGEDIWDNKYLSNVKWFNLNLTDKEILEHLNREFDNYFCKEDLDYEY